MQTNSSMSVKSIRLRKSLLVLPLIIIPFMTMLLWSLGVIGETNATTLTGTGKGFNAQLPDASAFRDSSWNKLMFYEQSDKDSERIKALQKNDPNYALPPSDHPSVSSLDSLQVTAPASRARATYDPYSVAYRTGADANEEKVNRKLAQLQDELEKGKKADALVRQEALPQLNRITKVSVGASQYNQDSEMRDEIQHVEGAPDPEMTQISGMLERILDIQHPERVVNKLQQQSSKNAGLVFPVVKRNETLAISNLNGSISDSGVLKRQVSSINGFYSIGDQAPHESDQQNSISAIIPETQTLVVGATVKLQLMDDIYVNGVLVPANEYLYGIAGLDGERLTVSVKTIVFERNILPVSLIVYDLDGIQGIYVPGAISRDVAKQSTEQAIQGIGLSMLDPSVGAQAAGAGIQAAKSLIGKKIKQIKVNVRRGYRVMLRDQNQKNQ